MITWATTVAPQTESSHSYGFYSVYPFGVDGSQTQTFRGSSTSWQNWSQTTYSTIYLETNPLGQASSSNSYESVLGTTNSTTFKTRVLTNGVTQSYEYGYTTRSVINTTSTETTRQYTYGKTGTTQSSFTYPSTTAFDTLTLTAPTSSSATTVIVAATSTTQESCYSTTTGADTVRTPILATVVLADKNEAIWAANLTAATDFSGLRAATSAATSTTKTTIMPWTQTVEAPQAASTQTTVLSIPQVSQAVTFTETGSTVSQTTRIAEDDWSWFPQVSRTTQVTSKVTTAVPTTFSILPATTITATASKITETVYATSAATVPVTVNGSAFGSSTAVSQTYTRENTISAAETSTYTNTYSIIVTSRGSVFTDSTTYTVAAIQSHTTSNNLTTFALQPQAMSSNIGGGSVVIEGVTGVYDEGSVVGGYSCEPIGFVFNGIVEVSRSVFSATPTVTAYSTTYAITEEEGSYALASVGGTITISSLSVTVAPSSTSTTTSFVLRPYGSGHPVAQNKISYSAIDASSLGESETIYQMLARGVYSVGSSTISTTGGWQSWSRGDGSQGAAFAISDISPTTYRNGASPIWWTVSRNSHPSLTALTNAGEYSAL